MLVGEVAKVARGPVTDYSIYWQMSADLPVDFQRDHLRLSVFKGNKTLKQKLIHARDLYDSTYPDKPFPELTKRGTRKKGGKSKSTGKTKSKPSQKAVSPNRARRVRLTELRMSPTTSDSTVPTLPNTLHREDSEDSVSDDGSEVMQGDTYYMPSEDIDDDPTYNVDKMEMKGNYG